MTVKKTTYTLLPKQGEFLFGYKLPDDPKKILNDIALYQGGFGSGKTFCGSFRGLVFAFTFPGCRGLVGAMSQDLLDNTTKKKYLEHLENMGLKEGVHWWFTDRKTTLNFINGSQIRFRTLSDWRQFRSEEFTFIEFEEASFLDEEVFINLIGRLRQPKKEEWGDNYYRALFMHTNPQGRRGWIYKHFINPKTRKKSYRCVIAPTRENHHLGDEYVEMLEELYSQEQIQEMVEGLDVDYDNTVAFPQFTEDNIRNDLKYNPNESLILTCDFNYNPMCWYLVQEFNKEWHILEELIDNNVTTKDMCKGIMPILAQYNTRNLTIMGDAHGKDRKTNGSDYSVMLAHFVNAGYAVDLRVQKSNPVIKDRLAVLRGLICNAKGVRRVLVSDKCKWLIYNFEECKNHLGNGGLKLPTDSDIQNDDNKRYLIHPIDAISYPMHFLQSLRAVAGEQEKI